MRLLERHYPFFFAHTDSCAKPLPSLRFQERPYSKGLCRLLPAPCCVKALPNAISVVLPYVPGPLLQLLPRCCFPFLPLGHWPSPSEHGSALGFAPPLLLRMVKILELQSFHYVPAHRFVRLTGSSYPHTSQCRAAETFPAAHITVGYLPRAAAMLSTQTGQLVVRGLAPLRSDRLVGYSVGIEMRRALHLRVRWLIQWFPTGPQSGSHHAHVSASPPAIPSIGISPTRF